MIFRTSFIIIAIFLIAGEVKTEDPGNFIARAGLGYDFISQEYYLDTARYDPDSVLTATLLKKDYLDDKKGLLYMKYSLDANSWRSIEAGWEQTDEIYRAFGWGRYRLVSPYDQSRLQSPFPIPPQSYSPGGG